MGTRPLRQHHLADDGTALRVAIDPALADSRAAWHVHRDRLATRLASFGRHDWRAPTRCDAWSAREVVAHLVVVDGFWALTIGNGRAANEPTRFLTGFDPSSSTDQLTADAAAVSDHELLDRFVAGTAALAAVVDAIDEEEWQHRAESPLGHLPLSLMLGHAFWDSWLHERDIVAVTDDSTTVPADELLAVTWFNLAFVGLQGGTPHDPAPVGPGPDEPLDATVRFDELPDHPLRLRVDDGLAVMIGDAATAAHCGSAIEFVEGTTGRRAIDVTLAALPVPLAGQVARAHDVL